MSPEEIAAEKTLTDRDESQVARYLASSPEFFERHPEILAELNLPHQTFGSVSLIERQLLTLREKNTDLQRQLSEMIQAAHANEELLSQCAKLWLELFDARELQEITAILFRHLREDFGIDESQLWLCAAGPVEIDGVEVTQVGEIYHFSGSVFSYQEPVCGRISEQLGFFFKNYEELESVALVPLGDRAELGLLVLGSKDPQRFSADMGTTFLRIIGSLLEKQIGRL